jgi:hypothetical protein
VTDDAAIANLKALLKATELQSDLQGEMLEALQLLRRRIDAIEERELELGALLERVSETAALLCAMKAATLVVSCVKCGRRFAKEPGPELCGPCWVAAGRPGSVGLHVVGSTTTEGSNHDERA